MRFCINDMLYALSFALDCVEHDVIGVSTYHGPRVAAISVAMGRELGLSGDALLDLAACAILHDNALTESIRRALDDGVDISNLSEEIQPAHHCTMGEQNILSFPFPTDVDGFILYHHEDANGSGPFGKTAAETPMGAQIIHLADQLDAKFNLGLLTDEKMALLHEMLISQTNRQFSAQCIQLFERGCPMDFLRRLNGAQAKVAMKQSLPEVWREYTQDQIIDICTVMAKIIDYKSKFTRRHSLGIAQKAMAMGNYYGEDEETQTMLYFAGALHDVGKLVVDSDILEKPAKLTDQEYRHIQNHAYKSYEILSQIQGLGQVVNWAADHHERLNGKGYPFGKEAKDLGKMQRLMACLDVYQALTEERPYKRGLDHLQVMEIMGSMVQKNMLDGTILADIDDAYRTGWFKGLH